MDDPHQSDPFASAVLAVHNMPGSMPTARTIVDRTGEVVPSAELVGITIRAKRNRFVALEASPELARQLDDLQHALRAGPCIDAASEAGFVRSGNVGGDERWPQWGAQAATWGVHSVLSIGLFANEKRFGALNMYSTSSGAFIERDEVDHALAWATHAATALAHVLEVEGLETSMTSRHRIGIAQGVLMERYGLDETKAFSLLSRLSQEQNRKLRDVAADVVPTSRPAPDSPARQGAPEGPVGPDNQPTSRT